MNLLHSATMLVSSFGVAGVFFASILEEVVVIIPSSLIQLGAGFFLLHGVPLSIIGFGKVALFVALPAAVGVLLGSLPVYYLAYYGGEPAIRKWGKWFLVRWSQIERLSARLAKRKSTFWLFALLKFLPAVPSVVVTGFCGAVRIPLGRYAAITLVGVFARALMLGTMGWLAGGLYQSLITGFNRAESIGTVLIAAVVLGGLGYVYVHAKKVRSKKSTSI